MSYNHTSSKEKVDIYNRTKMNIYISLKSVRSIFLNISLVNLTKFHVTDTVMASDSSWGTF
jgi:hypothetical protein